jgi:hypothetical protein
VEDAPKVLGHAFILKWVVGATMVKLAQANKTTHHTYIMMVVRVTIFKLHAGGT